MEPLKIDARTLAGWLIDGGELALLDAREQGDYFHSHLYHAACVPLSQLELDLERLVPRRTTRMVWCDDGTTDLAARAAAKAIELGYDNVQVLEGGTQGWVAAGETTGGELYAGINVPSKAFGEYVEHTFDTPRIPAAELKSMIDQGHNMVVLDSRPMPEYTNMSIPTGIDCPGAELVHRVKEVVTDPDTTVVVNCAGRTRSIIGAQSLINAGLENRVVALENGTMGWELAGFTVDRGRDIHAPEPSPEAQGWSQAAADRVGERFDVTTIDLDQLASWQADPERTTYLLDVRTPAEFEAGHLAGSTSAPGGQLVQATDEYVATANARLVLVDDTGVRATMTASWLRQLGWSDAVVLGVDVSTLDGHTPDGQTLGLVAGQTPRPRLPAATSSISVADLAKRLDEADPPLIIELGSSVKYRRKGHIPGSWWGVRARLAEAHATISDSVPGPVGEIVLTSSDGLVARLAVAEAQDLWPDATVSALRGGTKAWRHAGHPMTEPNQDTDRLTTTPNDVWYKPYDHDDTVAEQHMRDYLTWEIALVEQIEADPTVNFPRFA